jgi:peptidoglycan/xylan/chitin deacetylase (PgdA/CDA1 family)
VIVPGRKPHETDARFKRSEALAVGLRSGLKSLIPRALVIRRLQETSSRAVLLTFDDGPHPEVTPAVLDRLARYGAKAAFFVIGRRVRRNGALVARIAGAGHAVGNHSHLHRDRYVLASGPQPTFFEYYRDCARCQAIIEYRVGANTRLFRPPGGRLTPTTLLVPKLLGLRCVTWSQEVKDWSFRHADQARAGAAELLRVVASRDIVLLHDDNERVLALLDTLLPELQARGYDLAAGIDQL